MYSFYYFHLESKLFLFQKISDPPLLEKKYKKILLIRVLSKFIKLLTGLMFCIVSTERRNNDDVRKSVNLGNNGTINFLRVLVGLGNGILTSSVYIVEVVSADNRGSVVMVSEQCEIISTGLL